jgi:hypothetical protein
MPNPFSITAAADSIRLDSQGRGSTTFTVSNTSGQIRRGRARLVPSDPGHASWLSVDGDAERNFTADGTHQYTVRIAVPQGTPAGRQTFGFDVVSVENPDEEWSQGPKVAFEVPPPPAKKPFPWWIIVVAVAVLVVGGLIFWLLSRNGGGVHGLHEVCQPGEECAQGLVCSDIMGGKQCLGSPGFTGCATADDCSNGLECSGGACLGPLHFATCDAPNVCMPGLVCANGICLLPAGSECSNDGDCSTGHCVAITLPDARLSHPLSRCQ